MSTAIREGSEEEITLLLKRNGVAQDLSTPGDPLEVIFHRMNMTTKEKDELSTINNPTEFAVTDAVNGEVTLTPTSSYWVYAGGGYRCYADVILETGKRRSFPATKNEHVTMTEASNESD